MSSRILSQVGRVTWPACFTLVFLSAFVLSGTQQPPLELDPSWHAALEYATEHRLQFGTQIVFTFGPLGFLTTRTSLGRLVAARVAFAFFWSALVSFAATAVARRLPGWVRYAFIAWLAIFTLSEGFDQVALFVMAYGALVLLTGATRQRWQTPILMFAFVVLSLIKLTFFTAAAASLALGVACALRQRKILRAAVLVLAPPVGFIALWMALGQSASHLIPWFRNALELESGYSAAMNLAPKTAVLWAGLAAMALFALAILLKAATMQSGFVSWAILITITQYVFVAWKEGFTRSGDWHTFVFLWFLPLGVAFCFLETGSGAGEISRWRGLEVIFGASIALCLAAAHFQLSGFAWRQLIHWPLRTTRNAGAIVTIVRGHTGDLYRESRDTTRRSMLMLDHAKDVIGSESVDAMNYLLLAPIANSMNYQPRPIIQGFVAYTPALQQLNAGHFLGAARPHFVLLCHEATDGRFPTLEDSVALNYVLNNYIPVAWDGRFLVLKQKTAIAPSFRLVLQKELHFGEWLDVSRWSEEPLFMSAAINPSVWERLDSLLYQPEPLYMRAVRAGVEERYRIVSSMVERPFLVNPLLTGNFDVMNLYASHPGKELARIMFERPEGRAFEFKDDISVRLYTAAPFPLAARGVPVSRMLADVQGRVFWPEPESVESASPPRITVFDGTPALIVGAPSLIETKVPQNATVFSGYFGITDELYGRGSESGGVEVSITAVTTNGEARLVFDRVLQPLSRPGANSRFPIRIPIDASRDRSMMLVTRPIASDGSGGGFSFWSNCRFEVPH
jgi:hypothetical protein